MLTIYNELHLFSIFKMLSIRRGLFFRLSSNQNSESSGSASETNELPQGAVENLMPWQSFGEKCNKSMNIITVAFSKARFPNPHAASTVAWGT